MQGRLYRDIHGIISTTCDVFPSYCIDLTPPKGKRKKKTKKIRRMRNEILTDCEAEIRGYGEKEVLSYARRGCLSVILYGWVVCWFLNF